MGIVPSRRTPTSDEPKQEGEAMNYEWIRAELDSLEVNFHALHEMKRKLDPETIARCMRLEAQFEAELQRVQSMLTALGMPTAKS